jgi:hypothetical protein
MLPKTNPQRNTCSLWPLPRLVCEAHKNTLSLSPSLSLLSLPRSLSLSLSQLCTLTLLLSQQPFPISEAQVNYVQVDLHLCKEVKRFCFVFQNREMTLLISSYINSAHQQKAATHHLSAPALLVAQPVNLKSKELRSKSPPAAGRPSKAPTLL